MSAIKINMYTGVPYLDIPKLGPEPLFQGEVYSPEAGLVFDEISTSISSQWKNAYNNFIVGNKADGNWTKFEAIWWGRGPTQQASFLNIKKPTRNTITGVSSPTWDYYFEGNGTSSYFNPNYNPTVAADATVITSTNNAFGCYQLTSIAETSKAAFGLRNASNVGLFLNTQNTTNQYQASLWSSLSTIGTPTDGSGLHYVYRTDNTSFQVGRNGSQTATSSKASSGFLNGNIYLCANNQNGTAANFSTNKYAMFFVCKGDVDWVKFNARVLTFLSECNQAIVNDLINNYHASIEDQGGTLSSLERNGMTVLYAYMVNNGYLQSGEVKEFGTFLGGNLNSSLVKAKIISGGSTVLANNNFVSGDYSNSLGINISTNSNKFLGTGITPSSNGMSATNFSAMVYRTTEVTVTTNSFMMGLNNASGFNEMSVGYEVGMDSNLDAVPTQVGMIGITSVTNTTPYFEFTQVLDDFAPGALAFDTELTLFKGTRSGTDRFTAGGIGFYSVGKGMTKARYIALTQAVYTFLETIGRRTNGSDFVICGDSVTLGTASTDATLRYSRKLANYYGLREANFGLGGTRLRDRSTDKRDFEERYPELANYRIGTNYSNGKVHCQYLINDMTLDSDPNGTQATADACRDVYITIINYLINTLGVPAANISIGGPGYTTAHNDTKRAMYAAAARAAAVSTGVKFCDINQDMIDTGSPGDLLSDTVHPNDNGHEEYYQSILTADFVS